MLWANIMHVTREYKAYQLIDQLKKGKSDGSSLFSDGFTFAKNILSYPLSQLFTAVIRHGYIPKLLRDCISFS